MFPAPEPYDSWPLSALIDPDPTEGSTPTESPRREPTNRRLRASRSVGGALRGIGPVYRRHIRAAYRRLGGRCRPLNPERRALLAEAIFTVEDDLEHRQRLNVQVAIMRAARNALYDDLGWNETPHRRRAQPITNHQPE
jgi:hypothetical protein